MKNKKNVCLTIQRYYNLYVDKYLISLDFLIFFFLSLIFLTSGSPFLDLFDIKQLTSSAIFRN